MFIGAYISSFFGSETSLDLWQTYTGVAVSECTGAERHPTVTNEVTECSHCGSLQVSRYFFFFLLDELAGLWYNGMVREPHQRGKAK